MIVSVHFTAIRLGYFYSGLGQLIQKQVIGAVVNGSQANAVTDTSYDILGRQVKITVPYTSAYNASPSFITQTFSQAYTLNQYDIYGRLTSSAAPNGNTTTYAYNGLSTSVMDPMSQVTTTSNDAWGRVVSVDEPTGPDLAYVYNALDQLVSVTKGSGLDASTINVSYDPAGRKTAMSDPDMGTWAYEYDAVGNLVSQADARGCGTFLAYDLLNRLTGKTFNGDGACDSTASITYTYDSGANGVGRRTGMSDGTGSTAWAYDNRGRTVSETKTIDVTTYYPSAAYQVKTNGSYANTRKYYSFNGAVVAMRENSTLTWLLHTCPGGRCQGDQVNSTTVTANADGSFQSEVRYSAYGEVRHADGTTVTDKLYTGQQQEVEIGLSYYIARFYDPVIAHFIQADTIISDMRNAQGYNRYGYVLNNPVNFHDPSGHMVQDDQIGGTSDAMKKVLKLRYDWTLLGEWNVKQTLALSEAGKKISNYLGSIRSEDGDTSVKEILGGTIFRNNTPLTQLLNSSIGPTKTNVSLLKDFENKNWEGGVEGMIIHELGHIIDNRNKVTGGLPAVFSGGEKQIS